MSKKLYSGGEWVICFIGFFIATILLVERLFHAFYRDDMGGGYRTCISMMIISCLLLGGLTGLMARILKGMSERLLRNGLMLVCMLYQILFAMSLFIGSQIYFASDPGAVTTLAMQFSQGDYSAIIPRNSYLALHPQQYGIIFVYEMIYRFIGTNGKIIQAMNLGLVLLETFSMFGIVQRICKNSMSFILLCILQMTSFPLLLYSTVAYGDLASVCFTVFTIFCMGEFFCSQRDRWLIFLSLGISCSCLFKKNSLIVLIALCVVFLFSFLKKFNWKVLVWLLITFFLAINVNTLVKCSYELRSGSNSGEGLPMVTYVALSMQEGLGGPGCWSGYHVNLYMENDYQAEPTKKAAKDMICSRMNYFGNHLPEAFAFYRDKIAYQWTEGSYDGIGSGIENTFTSSRSQWIESIVDGKMKKVIIILSNANQCVLYLGVFLFAISLIMQKKQKRNIPICVVYMLTILVGGFLFELIWESASRYVWIYCTSVMPLAVCGISERWSGKLQGRNERRTVNKGDRDDCSE